MLQGQFNCENMDSKITDHISRKTNNEHTYYAVGGVTVDIVDKNIENSSIVL